MFRAGEIPLKLNQTDTQRLIQNLANATPAENAVLFSAEKLFRVQVKQFLFLLCR